ncbi:MAG: GNAT family N-acetyltransferase [candidate division KSB1 bacterium]|nr:GNAT family N-acetyltransferase [candidate division KSB1 bacterium]MDZ7274899.1 GNAT family N-acetyltransferase [candidate division KSB1 bacterium]MDZ7286649.1 GNAT family N-acetyltransferase [candidate division KSB1 bacterium]MDZ7299188.1 GNAT family N-acetyltransferase [candidate division KSB1 bacterium]MDZ7308504.1 GNAT family N-acetyltransferase [candidate division KSB1 bacterium]
MTTRIHLRPAGEHDSEDVLRWRNDPVTRANSFHSDPISPAEHRRWFSRTLARRDRLLLIGMAGSERIGVVRFDLAGDSAEININLAPEARGRGLGTALIAAGSGYVFEHHPAITKIYAKIKPQNTASLRAFEKAGYCLLSRAEHETYVLTRQHSAAAGIYPNRRLIVRQVMQLSGANVIVQAARFVKNFLLARLLGPQLFGLWNGLQILLVYGVNAHLGVLNAMNREVPLCRGRGASAAIPALARVSLTFTMLATLVLAAGLVLISMTPLVAGLEAVALRLLAAVLLAQQLYQFFQFWLRADDRFDLLSRTLVVSALIELVVTVAWVYHAGFTGIFHGFLAGALVAVALCLRAVDPVIWRLNFDFRLIPPLLRLGFPMMIVGLSYSLMTTLDRVLIIHFLGSEQLGYYALGPLVLAALTYVPATINQVIYPKLGERYGATGDPRSVAGYVIRPTVITAYLMALVLGGAYLGLPLLLEWLPKYRAGLPAARILFAGFYFLSLVGASANLLVTINRQIQYLISLFAAIALGLLLNFAAIFAGWGIAGIAATTSVTYFLYAAGVIGFTARRHLGFHHMLLRRLAGRLMLPYLLAAVSLAAALQIDTGHPALTPLLQVGVFVLAFGLLAYVPGRREWSS